MEETTLPNENGTSCYFVAVRFRGSDKSYNFSTVFDDFKVGDLVIVETSRGLEMGVISGLPKPISLYHSDLELKPIVRKPNALDMERYEHINELSKRALEITATYIKNLGLAMDLIDAVYSLDGSEVLITYTTPEKRVDFRDLLHLINPALDARVELRQIASRDKAKMIGGIGICGLPLCCSTFLTTFEGISIQRAKNQMLTLNIPKLSGPCGKLICCLVYEDDAYTEAKKEFPRPGTIVKTPEGEYAVDSFNVISKNVRLVNAGRDDWKTYTLEEVRAMQNGTYKKMEEKNIADELPDFNLTIKGQGENKPQPQQNNNQNGRVDNRNNNQNRRDNRNNRHNNQNQNRQNQQQNNNQNAANPGQNKQNHHHNYRRHGHRPGNKPNNGGGQNA